MRLTGFTFTSVLAAQATNTLCSIDGGSVHMKFSESDDWHVFTSGEKIIIPPDVTVSARCAEGTNSAELKFSPFGA